MVVAANANDRIPTDRAIVESAALDGIGVAARARGHARGPSSGAVNTCTYANVARWNRGTTGLGSGGARLRTAQAMQRRELGAREQNVGTSHARQDAVVLGGAHACTIACCRLNGSLELKIVVVARLDTGRELGRTQPRGASINVDNRTRLGHTDRADVSRRLHVIDFDDVTDDRHNVGANLQRDTGVPADRQHVTH